MTRLLFKRFVIAVSRPGLLVSCEPDEVKGSVADIANPSLSRPVPGRQVIVLEDKAEYVKRSSPERVAAMRRMAFPAFAVCNPSLRAVGSEGALFFEGCLSIPGYQVGPRLAALAEGHPLSYPMWL